MMNTTKRTEVVIVTPEGDARVEEWEGDTLPHLQKAVGGLVDVVQLADGFDLWLNDEGMYTEEPNRPVSHYVSQVAGRWVQTFHGTAVFTGCDDEGSTTSLPETWRRRVLTAFTFCPGCEAEAGEVCAPSCLSGCE